MFKRFFFCMRTFVLILMANVPGPKCDSRVVCSKQSWVMLNADDPFINQEHSLCHLHHISTICLLDLRLSFFRDLFSTAIFIFTLWFPHGLGADLFRVAWALDWSIPKVQNLSYLSCLEHFEARLVASGCHGRRGLRLQAGFWTSSYKILQARSLKRT